MMRCYLCLFFLLSVQGLWGDRPNVIIFLTDDQGWGDLSYHGNKNLSTPYLDSLARDGASFENFYVCQVCAPTRAEFLTGRYHLRTGVSGVTKGHGRLNADEVTIADVFKQAGYATGCFGKWHNGTQPPYHPNYRGFDEFYGFTSGHWGHYFSPPLDHNGKRVKGNGFIVDDFTDKALDFIEEHKSKPFFCYLPYNTPHSPMYVKDEDYQRFESKTFKMNYRDVAKEDLQMTKAALALCENIDQNVGRVLERVEKLGLEENTIVMFFSDNGPNSYRWNGGMKGKKGTIDEGGLRSPLFIKWPKKIKSGHTVEQVVGAIDLFPTLMGFSNLTDSKHKSLDGKNIAPLLFRSSVDWKDRFLYSIKGKQVSVRTQDFRLGGDEKLYHIKTDRGQRRDVSKEYPEIKTRLKGAAQNFSDEMKRYSEVNSSRPYTVGYATSTTLTARDGVATGTIQRSSKSANNSFFTHWSDTKDQITWNVEVVDTAEYEVILHYTCAKENVGTVLKLSDHRGNSTSRAVNKVFNPPLYGKEKERMQKSHYFMKDFIPTSIGTIKLEKGKSELVLEAINIPGELAIDIIAIDLIKR